MVVSAKVLFCTAPLIDSGFIHLKANFIKFLILSSRLYGQLIDKIIFESVCSIKHTGIVNSSIFISCSIFLKLFLLFSLRSIYFFNSQSVPSEA